MRLFRPGPRSLLLAALPLVCLLLTISAAPEADAQALPTASKGNSLSAFGGFTYANPEYGQYYDKGFALGFNIIHHVGRLPFDPSLEARANFLSGTDVSERTYLFGVRAEAHGFFHVHPYGDFLAGPGNIHFNLSNGSSYVGDNSLVYNYGGGLDIDAYRQFQVKFDIQRQRWSLGQPSIPFEPVVGLVGVTYRFHFHDYNKQGDAK